MSHYCDEYYSLYKEVRFKARKEHTCDACGETVQPGHYYHRISIMFEGEARTVKRCLRCQAIHLHLRSLEPGEMWPNEKLDCGMDYKVEWGQDPPPEVAALAFITPEESQVRLV